MTDDVKLQIAEFFGVKYRLSPEVSLPSPESLPRGWFEEVRAGMFRSTTSSNVSLQTGELWSELSGKVYVVSNGQLSVVLARYNDGTILWLDDHSKDADFQSFIRRERLLAWLSHRLDKLLHLVIETRLNFLGRPQLISSAMEVPELSEGQKTLWIEDEETQRFLLEQEKRLADISGQIRPPALVTGQEGGLDASFYVWTKILGKIISVRCFFGPNSTFRCEGAQLTQFVGNYIVPR